VLDKWAGNQTLKLEILNDKLNDLRNENKLINLGLFKIREAINANEF